MNDLLPLTERQRSVLLYMRTYIEEHGYAPSIREIGGHFGIGHDAIRRGDLNALERKGNIVIRRRCPESWKIGTIVKVNPAYTSQTCSGCGHRQKMPLAQRVYRCPCCKLEIDRDHNAALNILALGLQDHGIQPEEAAAL